MGLLKDIPTVKVEASIQIYVCRLTPQCSVGITSVSMTELLTSPHEVQAQGNGC